MGILDEDVARVRDATDLVALAGEHLALKRVGRRFVGLCPFHAEKTPSFPSTPSSDGTTASVARRAATRSRSCARSSTSTSSTRSSGSRRAPASRCATTTRPSPRTARASSGSSRRSPPRSTSTTSCCSSRADGGARARGYLRSRGFDGDAVRQFQLGWSPDDWDRLSVHLQQQEVRARRHRRRRARVREQGEQAAGPVPRLGCMFPIYDSRGDAVGFGGRALGDERPEVQELAGDADLPEEPVALRAQLGEGRDRRAR